MTYGRYTINIQYYSFIYRDRGSLFLKAEGETEKNIFNASTKSKPVTGPERGGGGGGALPARLAIVTDCGKSCREQGNLVVKEAVAAVMIGWGSPFRCAPLLHG